MTIGEVVLPVIVQVAYGIAVAAVLWLVWHVRRRYPSVPKRISLRLRFDGRPSKPTGPRVIVWVAPIALVLVTALLTVLLVKSPPPPDQRVQIALVFVILAETAWATGWSTDRQIELARGMTYRVAPARMLRVFAPILVTVAVTLFLAIRPA
jgi:hypothetical protein